MGIDYTGSLTDRVLALLTAAGGEALSGEAMSARLGVSRAAVHKAISGLRADGFVIEAAPRRGYRLTGGPDRLTAGTILPHLRRADSGRLICLDTVGSTNDYAKALAVAGGEDGTAVAADGQTGGRGRQGRSFASPKGKGIYLSMLYRPALAPAEAVSLTACAAVAVCAGIEAATGAKPGIKWTNDIVLDGRKLCGILTEMAVEGETGALQYVVTGVGVNVNHEAEDFPPDVRDMAVSLRQALGRPVPRGPLCAALINALDETLARRLAGDRGLHEEYRRRCLTLGKPVRILRGDRAEEAFAEDLDDDLALIVRYPDGRRETVSSGEVSVRGLYGYA